LEAAWVIPVNSPPYTAPYNGAIEHTQGEFKKLCQALAVESQHNGIAFSPGGNRGACVEPHIPALLE